MTGHLSRTITIGDRIVGEGHPVFIIAEIGVNHNGDMDLARRSIDAAAEAGVDCVKFQTFRAEEFMADRDVLYEYESGGKKVQESMYDMFKRLELPLDWHQELFAHARKRGVAPLTSVADPVCMHVALEGGVAALKLASEDLINIPLLEAVAGQGRPVLLSTGMAGVAEIERAVDIFRDRKSPDVAFLHCVSLYPTPDAETNLYRMTVLAEMTGRIVGYSDHTIGPEACFAAVALGGKILEKHFTLDKKLPGPDHAFSSDPGELCRLVQGIRRIEKQLGAGAIDPGPSERAARRGFRRSIVAARDLGAGTILAKKDLALKRPGTGLHPMKLYEIVGKSLKKSLRADEQVTLEALEPGGTE